MPDDLTLSGGLASGGVAVNALGGITATTGALAIAAAASAATAVVAADASIIPIGATSPGFTGSASVTLNTSYPGVAGCKLSHPNSSLSASTSLWNGIGSIATASVSGSFSPPGAIFSLAYNVVEPTVTLGGYTLLRRGTSGSLPVLPLSAVSPWSIGITYSLGSGFTATNLSGGTSSVIVKDSSGITLATGSGAISAGASSFSGTTINPPCDGIDVITLKLTTTGPLVSTQYYNCAIKSNTSMTIVGDPEMNEPTPGEALLKVGIIANYSF